MLTTAEHYYSLAQFSYILSALFFAAVRWFHMCRPYDANPDYYYPGRREIVVVSLCALILVPFVLCPLCADTWMLAKAYYLILIPFFIAFLLYKYFGRIKQWDGWRRESAIIGILFTLSVLSLFLLAVMPHEQLQPQVQRTITNAILCVGAVSLGFYAYASFKIYQWMQQYFDENYSNEDDFPILFARKMLMFPLVPVIPIVIAVVTDSKVGIAVVGLLMTICNVVLLIIVLHPQRKGTVKLASDSPAKTEDNQQTSGMAPSERTIEAIEKSIRESIEDRQLYLNQHLSMQDVVDKCGFGRTYVSWVFKNRLGGFFYYVNYLRLEYAAQYRQQHPMATLDEVATASGFATRQSYYRVKRRIEELS